MAEKNNAECKICGKPYYVCRSCASSMKLHPWKTFTDNADCYKVFQAVKGFSTGVYTKEEFKSKLKNIDLSDLENYRDHIKSLIKDTLKEDEVVVEEFVIEKAVSDKAITDEVTVKTTASRKRNYKTETE